MAVVAIKLLVNDKTIPCVKQICRLCVISKVSDRQILSGETFCFHEKRLLSIFKFCAVSNFNIVFLRAADWPTANSANFPGMFCYFPVIRLVKFV